MIYNIKKEILAQGRMDQMILLLTGSVKAGKTTVITAAEQFCYDFLFIMQYYDDFKKDQVQFRTWLHQENLLQ